MKPRILLSSSMVFGAGAFLFNRIAIWKKIKKSNLSDMFISWAKYSPPGRHHRKLEPLAGSWELTARWWPEPNGQPLESKIISQRQWIMGKRFLLEKIHDMSVNSPFHGMSILGFDNIRGEFTCLWIDEISTSFTFARGASNIDGNIIALAGTRDDLLTGERDKKFANIIRIFDHDHHVSELYQIGGLGEKLKIYEIEYIRREAGLDIPAYMDIPLAKNQNLSLN